MGRNLTTKNETMTDKPEAYNQYRRRSVEAENNKLKQEADTDAKIISRLTLTCLLLITVIIILTLTK